MSSLASDRAWKPRRAAIIGVGMLGTSVALGLRQLWPDLHVVGTARREPTRRAALDLGALHEATDSLTRAAQNADLVVVCTPVDLVAEHVCQAATVCAADALITDVGSTKADIVAAVEKNARAATRFVGAHPLAGSEKTGPWHGRAELLRNRLVVLTPTSLTPAPMVKRCEGFWQALGSRTVQMLPMEHDLALAATSHVPHLIASALAAATRVDLLQLVGTGWRDTTRIAGGDPGLWRAILQANASNVLQQLDQVVEMLGKYRSAIAEGRFEEVQCLLALGKEVHDANRVRTD